MTRLPSWLTATSAVPGRLVQCMAFASLTIAAAAALRLGWHGLTGVIANAAAGIGGWYAGRWMVHDARARKARLAEAQLRARAAEIARQRIDLQRRNARWS